MINKVIITFYFLLLSGYAFGQREDCMKIEKAFNENNIDAIVEYVSKELGVVIFSSSVPKTDLEENPISKLEFKKKITTTFQAKFN